MSDPLEARNPMEARRRCTARARSTGERCGNRPIPGGMVCRFHGGGAPAVKQKAALRLAQLVDPAIGTLARVMVKAEKDADKLRAANSILDRAGISRGQNADAEVARALLLERLMELRAANSAQPADAAEEILDAEVVEGDEGR